MPRRAPSTDTPSDGPARAACTVCGRTVRRPAVCYCCRLVARQLGVPLVPVVVRLQYRLGDAHHRRLRGYKDAPSAEVRARCRRQVVADLAAWGRADGGDLLGRLGPWSVVTTVPSTRRPGPAPAEGLVEEVPWLADRHLRLLGRGSGTADHLVAARDAFAPLPGVDRSGLDGLPVLVFEDSVATGARSQSAAAALRLAGVHVVGILAVGRALALDATSSCHTAAGDRSGG